MRWNAASGRVFSSLLQPTRPEAGFHQPPLLAWPELWRQFASMKTLTRLACLFLASVLASAAAEVTKVTPAEAAQLVAAGKAVLVDVREPAEWAETGVAAPAVLLAKSEFDAGQSGEWKHFLAGVGDRQIILYCRSGQRAGGVGAVLADKGFKVANAGGFTAWQKAGLPTRTVPAAKP